MILDQGTHALSGKSEIMPRPKSDNARTRQINISVSAAEYAAIATRAKALGIKPVVFGRAAMLDTRYLPASTVPASSPQETLMLLELRRIGNNLNQLVRLAHRNGTLPPDDLQALLGDIRRLLARAASRS